MSSETILTHQYVLVSPLPPSKSKLSVPEYIIQQIKEYGTSVALVHSLTEESATYDGIVKETIKVAEGLRLKGIQPDDVVAVCCENRLEYAPVILGILSTGATCCLLNPVYNIGELVHVLSISRPKIVFCSAVSAENIKKCQLKLPFIKELILFSKIGWDGGYSLYDKLIDNSGRLETYQFPKLNVEESVAFLLCSSGTTGLPKCVELTHSNFTCVLGFIRSVWEKESGNKVTLGLIPFFHGYGCCVLLLSLFCKIFHVVMAKFSEENFLSSIEKFKITDLYLVPPLVVFLSKHPLVSKYDMSSVRRIMCGAAPLNKDTQQRAQKRLNLDFEIQQAYGMTELSIVSVAFQGDVRKVGSSGTVVPGMECKVGDVLEPQPSIVEALRIEVVSLGGTFWSRMGVGEGVEGTLRVVDLITKKALPPYQRGELCFRGPHVMKGYRNNPEATREVFDHEGWFHTGDIGYYDSEGFLFIVDRLKELIKYKGFQVPPAELETILINHPQIKEAGVIGIPDEEAGELPLAFVVLQPGAKLTAKEIQNYVAGKVSPQKRLHGGVRFINEIPKNPSGKILRRELRSLVNKSKL